MVRHDFLFIAGDPALDVVNTEIVRDGEPVDLLDGTDALEQWLREAKLGPVTPAMLKDAKRLRAALRAIVSGASSSPRTINEELRRGPGTLALRGKDGGYEVAFEPAEEDPRFVLARAAAIFSRAPMRRASAAAGARAASSSSTARRRAARAAGAAWPDAGIG